MKKGILFLLFIVLLGLNMQKSALAVDAFENKYQDANESARGVSQIEQMFNGEEAIKTRHILRQVGYDIFSAPAALGANTTGKFDNSYKLSVGEKVNVYLYGDSVDIMAISNSNLLNPVIKTEVDSKGSIFIQGIGPVSAENKTISQVESAINSMASKKYKSIKVKLTVSSGQDFSVFVYGHVKRPGKVLLSNNSTLVDALGAAGGVKKTGSLRNISYSSGSTKRTVDLYRDIFTKSDNNIILRPNDKIFVPAIGNVVALRNGVTVPGIYEAKQGENLLNMITYAGGVLAGTQYAEVVVTSLNTTTKQRDARNIAWGEIKNIKLKSGDTIEFKELYNEAENMVVLQGNIKHPATFAYKKGMRLSDILKNENELLEETFVTQAVIRRISGQDNTVETIPVFLKEFFAGTIDPQLEPKDIITIYKNTNAQFVDVYGCINIPKHITYIDKMTLDDVMTDIQFVESDTETDIQQDKNVQNVSYSTDGNSTILLGGTYKTSNLIPAENVAVEITGRNGKTQLYFMYDIMINSDRIKAIDLHPSDKVFFRTLRHDESVKSVKVSGFVKHPGVFKFVDGKKLTDMIEMAGGLTDDADLSGIIYKRKNLRAKQIEIAKRNNERDIKHLAGRMATTYNLTDKELDANANIIQMLKSEKQDLEKYYTGQIALSIKSNDLSEVSSMDNVDVQDGDDIYIPRASMHVSVLGEVYNEQAFAYKKGANVKTYIKAVGGFTPNASRSRMYKVGINGRAKKVSYASSVEPGDTIIVPRKMTSVANWIQPVMQGLQSICYATITALAVARWK